MWDAPGMQRIKIPAGGLNAAQLETLAELAEEYSDGIAHVTTRQDFQLHYVHIDDTPSLMRRLAAAGITTREACGNSVRNVTACPYAGVCPDEEFRRHALRARAVQIFARPSRLPELRPQVQAILQRLRATCLRPGQHARPGYDRRDARGKRQEERGFEMYVGGGLGAVPYQAKLFDSFVPPEELLPMAQAIARVFARLGEKKNRSRARIKFLIQDLGIEKFRELVLEERKILPTIRAGPNTCATPSESQEAPLKPRRQTAGCWDSRRPSDAGSRPTLGRRSKPGYVMVTIALPLGDITANQLARAGRYRPPLHQGNHSHHRGAEYRAALGERKRPAGTLQGPRSRGPGRAGAGTIVDITTCPGTDTCKLGISSSRGLAAELRKRSAEKSFQFDEPVENLHIKISGCFNSCGQHHVADLGFYGVSRKMAGYAVPHFQVVLGGEWEHNGGSYGLPVMAIPSKNIPEVVTRLTDRYAADRQDGESFKDFIKRIGKAELKNTAGGSVAAARRSDGPLDLYRLGRSARIQPRRYGRSASAPEKWSRPIEFDLAAAEREVFEAQMELENGQVERPASWRTRPCCMPPGGW